MNDALKNSDPALHPGVRDELRLRVLRALEANPELSQRQLAAELGVSLGGVNYALKALVERGFVKADNFRKSGSKVAYLYLLTPQGVAEKASLATAFLGRKLEEYEVLRQEIEALKGEVGSGDSADSRKGAES
jgi:EPS-associated MarR family transcriptional regulator